MKLPFKLSLPTFGKRRKASADDEDDDGRVQDIVADDDEEDRPAGNRTVILDDPDAEDENDAGLPDTAPDGGRIEPVLDDRRGGPGEADGGDREDDDPPPFSGSFAYDDDDDEDEEGRRRPIAMIAAAAAVAGLLAVGGGAWWWLGTGSSADEQAADEGLPLADSDVPSVTVALPPARMAAAGSLNSLAAGNGEAPSPPPAEGQETPSSGALAPPPLALAPPPDDMKHEAPAPHDGGAAADGPLADHAAGAEPGHTPAEAGPGAAAAGPGDAEAGHSATEAGHGTAETTGDGAAPPVAHEPPASLNAVAEGLESPDAGIIVASASPQAFAGLPAPPAASPLPPVPDAGLIEEGPYGKLPRVDGDGRRPWRIYARPFAPPEGREKWPRIAILMGGLGLGKAPTEAAIRTLPAAVSLVFDPYAKNLEQWVPRAREAGHEFLIALPMEPMDFPVTDPGPMGLLTTLEPAEMRKRMDSIFGRMAGYVGIFGQYGSRYMTDEKDVMPVLTAMKWRGLMFVDGSGSAESLGPVYADKINLAMATVQVVLDGEPTALHIDQQLAGLESLARAGQAAVGLGHPYPRTLERLAAWAAGLEEKGILLAPVTAVVKGEEKPE